MTKADVLSNFPTLRVAVSYGKEARIPYGDTDSQAIQYRDFEGWQCDISHCRRYEELPQRLREYIEFIEHETGVPISIISLGPDREDTLIR